MTLDLLFPYFDTLIRTPEDVARLNEAILALAVRGQLVPQDPADEPAGELLKRIRAEKRRLVREGKIREAKVSRRIEPADAPYELPESWEWVRLGSLAESMTNGIYKPANFYDDDGVACLRMYNIQDGRISFHDLKRMDLTGSEIVMYGLREGDLLVNRVNSRELVGKAAVIPVVGEPLVYESKNIRVRFLGELTEAHFINIAFRTSVVKTEFEQSAKQTTGQASVNQAHLNDLMIPLPPLAEQRRIVAKVESLFAQTRALEAKLRQAQADLVTVNRAALHRLAAAADDAARTSAWAAVRDAFDLLYDDPRSVAELRQAILQLAVQGQLTPQDPADEPASELLKRIRAEKRRLVKEGKPREARPLPPINMTEAPFELQRGWEWIRLPDVGELARGQSKHRPRNEPSLFENGRYPFVQTGDVARSSGLIRSYSAMYNDVGLAQSRLWPKGTLCITIAANIGETGILGMDACFPDSVVGFLPFSAIGHTEYFQYFLRVAKRQLEEFAPATAQKNINLGILESLLVPLPPAKELSRIVAKVDHLMHLCDALEAGLARAQEARRALAAAVLHGAFNPTR